MWQFYWKRWHLGHQVDKVNLDGRYGLAYHHLWFIGPLQIRYYSHRSTY
ncbi:hypothetical protein EVC27_003 [Rhizobium phage RHph_I1_6]|uniref:Uncharacterized protein n=1 Tax=Rhizobium phage RHph_I1_6 TaxID=2509728 RepID=A0A7S5RFE3_9CAUD|nr:hypothetical protein PP745_gp003 [Rhizobium phage RHph_I1_6]QIG76528.1 hypothetical protein EVC27_003 [Rhizobium phage RHph_I1_6]